MNDKPFIFRIKAKNTIIYTLDDEQALYAWKQGCEVNCGRITQW